MAIISEISIINLSSTIAATKRLIPVTDVPLIGKSVL